MGTQLSDIQRRQCHLALTAACFRAFADDLRAELVATFACSDADARTVADDAFLRMYEQLEAGVAIPCPPVWLYGTAARLMRRRRSLRWRLFSLAEAAYRGAGASLMVGATRLWRIVRKDARQAISRTTKRETRQPRGDEHG